MKYINFSTYPLFNPMYNPKEMLFMGVFGGTAFKEPTSAFLANYPKMPWDASHWGKLWDNKYNFFGVSANHYVFQIKQLGTYWSPKRFFEWYTDLYFSPSNRSNPDWDYYHISNWVHYISMMYEDQAELIEAGNPHILQALLEVGYDGKFKPNFDTKWIREQLPLKQYNLAI